jgi:hypothetical protein
MKISGHWIHPNTVTKAVKAIPQYDFKKYFQLWQHRLVKCIAVQGEYFEGDCSQ